MTYHDGIYVNTLLQGGRDSVNRACSGREVQARGENHRQLAVGERECDIVYRATVREWLPRKQ